MKLSHIGADFRIVSRTYFRNPVALFFSLIFPIILISLFGAIFSATGSGAVSLVVVNQDHNPNGVGYTNESVAFLQALNATTLVKVSVVDVTPQNFSNYLGQNGDTTGLIIPAGFENDYLAQKPVNLTVFTNPEDAAAGGTVIGAVQGVSAAFNLHRSVARAPVRPSSASRPRTWEARSTSTSTT